MASFLAIALILSYRISGFFFKLSITAISPWTCRSNALASHVLGDEPYNGVVDEGV
jgi:hypothetical protein